MPEIHVFDCDTLEPLRVIPVPALKNLWDITFSENILFVATYAPGVIHRIPLQSSQSVNGNSWSVGVTQSTLSSVYVEMGNILVSCYRLNKLMEYKTTCQLVREIPLQQDITNPTHAVQLDNDRFLVCHVGNLHRVCLVDNKGQLIKSYGRAPRSGPEQFIDPTIPLGR